MGFHDHLYPSNYYNEEELLSSDEYPPPLVNICARYCVHHLSKTLLEKIPVVEPIIEPIVKNNTTTATTNTSSSSSTSLLQPPQQQQSSSSCSNDDIDQIQYRLRPGVRLPSELSEKIFAYLDKHTTTAELLRSSECSSSSSSSSGASSSSDDDEDDDEVLGDNLMVIVGEDGNNMDADERVMLELQQRRRNILRQRRRLRRRRRRNIILRDHINNVDNPEAAGGGGADGAGDQRRDGVRPFDRVAAGGATRRKRRMLWNGGVGGPVPDDPNADDDEDMEIVGFDAIVDPLFKDPSHLPLTKLNLRTSTALTDQQLGTLLAHKPREVDIHDCRKLTSASLQAINENSQNLVSLTIGSTTQILPTIFLTARPLKLGFLNCPKLLKLVIWNLNTSLTLYWGHLTAGFTRTLTSLDLSGCGEFEDFEFLRHVTKLRSLVLYNVLISGNVRDDDEESEVRRKKKVKKRKDNGREGLGVSDHFMEQDNNLEDEVDPFAAENQDDDDDEEEEEVDKEQISPRRRFVLLLKDEEEGQRLMVMRDGAEHDNDNGVPGDNNIGYYAYRKRLEKLVNKLISPICDLKELRHLDISTSSDPSSSASLQASPNNLIGSTPSTPWSTYPNPNQVLSTIVQNLPKLTHLDISGTNLAGRGVAVLMSDQDRANPEPTSSLNDEPSSSSSSSSSSSAKLCDIPGLNSRVDSPLEFLGLYGTAHDASHRHCIPAKRISGDKDEAQILVACEAYIHRHEVLEKVLNDLFHLFRSERGTHITQSLRLILRAMNLHPSEKHVQISGSASLFYIVKNEQHSQGGAGASSGEEVINPPMKRMILSTIVNAMAIHKGDSTMARNGCLTICHFKIPQDVMFIYAKLVKILLKILGQSIGPNQRHESFVERIAIYLLNSLACQVEGWHKRLVGDLGAMKRMLQLIRDRLSRLECDDVMEIAWSTMWNVTDETPENCEKFLKNEGMALFLKCLQTFPNKSELLRNMMGLLGNVAEVGGLRKQLMTSEFISVFCELLDSTQDNIEVSYNAAGVLAHILSDGEEAWGITNPPRQVIQESMVRNVNRWNINSTRNINYRSFEPILRLLKVAHTRECQLWASWALANLTRVYPEKYVPLVEKESGLSPLRELLEEPLSGNSSCVIQQNVKKYARITLRNVDEFNKDGRIDLNSFMDG